jgi:hypothetical protein
MAMDGSYETKLLRLLIGYSHIAVLEQLALVRHSKSLEKLTHEEKTALENDLIGRVGMVAHSLTDEMLSGKLPITSPRPVN